VYTSAEKLRHDVECTQNLKVFFHSRAQGAPWHPKDSTSQKPGQGQKRLNRWSRSLRDHNHLDPVFQALLSVKIEPLRGRRWRILTPKIARTTVRVLTHCFYVVFLHL